MKVCIVKGNTEQTVEGIPEEYKNIEVRFSRYYKYEFWYEGNGIVVNVSSWDDEVFNAELLAVETVASISREAQWDSFTIIDEREKSDA